MEEMEEYEDDDFASDITEDDFEKEKSSGDSKLNTNNIIIAILIFIIIILLFIIFSRGKCEKCSSTKENDTKEESNNASESKKEDGLSEDTKEEIATKLAILFSDSNYEYGNLIQNNDIENYVANIFEDTLDDESRAILIMRSITSNTLDLNFDSVEFNKESYKDDLKTEDGKSIVYDNIEFIEKYADVFGVEPEPIDLLDSCPSYYYEQSNDLYVEKAGCNETATLSTYIYIDDISESGENIVVNTYVGAHRSSKSGEYYYDDYEYPKVKNKTIEETTITEENKESFSNYKFIFEKGNDGEYHYKSVEKVK